MNNYKRLIANAMKLFKYLFLIFLVAVIVLPIAYAEELVLQPGSEGKDAWINSSTENQGQNFGDNVNLVNNFTGKNHGLIEFDISSLPEGIKILNATLELMEDKNCHLNINSIELHLNQASWDESTVTWNNAPAYGSSIATPTGDTAGCEWLVFDVKSSVTAWYRGSISNYGFRITGPESDNVVKNIWSGDCDTSEDRPILRINYAFPPKAMPWMPMLLFGD